jgi:hypothetical protein
MWKIFIGYGFNAVEIALTRIRETTGAAETVGWPV